jgi:hypothetical protein
MVVRSCGNREPPVGIEPTTARLRIECSTAELRWRENALARTRTATPFGTTPSRWRVYQFHHQGIVLHDLVVTNQGNEGIGLEEQRTLVLQPNAP